MNPRIIIFLFLAVFCGSALAQAPVYPSLGAEVLDSEHSEVIETTPHELQSRSGGAAFGLSLLVPGLGHRYASGHWNTVATMHGLADAALWAGLVDANLQIGRAEESFETLAVSAGGAEGTDRSRGFYLNMATFRSSEEYIQQLLRNRAWSELEQARLPQNQWEWETEEDFQDFRDIREDAESLRRRRPIFLAMLAGNRILAGIGAIRASRSFNRSQAEVSLGMPPAGSSLPTVNMSLRF